MRAHADEAQYPGMPVEWRHGRCSYCGSMTVEEAIRLLTTPGESYSAADWKYGWPHKLYLGAHGKFYTTHLRDATPEHLAAFNAAAWPLIGLRFAVDSAGDLSFDARARAWTAFGTVPGSSGDSDIPDGGVR